MLALFKALTLWQYLVLVAVAGVGVSGGYFAYAAATTPSTETGVGKTQQIIPVQRGNLVNKVSTSGSLTFPNTNALTFGTAGTVDKVLVQDGQSVKKGEALATLDASTISTLQKAVAQAQVNLRNAQDNYEAAKKPYTDQQIAQAKSAVINAQISLRNAQDTYEGAKNPYTDLQIAQAQAAVINAQASLRNAQDAVGTYQAKYAADQVVAAHASVDTATLTLQTSMNDAANAARNGATQLTNSLTALTNAQTSYSQVLGKWLGINLAPDQMTSTPENFIASMGIDLNALFNPQNRSLGLNELVATTQAGPIYLSKVQGDPALMANGWDLAADNPATPWNETTVARWVNLTPSNTIIVSCSTGIVPLGQYCIAKEMDDAWNTLQTAQTNYTNQQATIALANQKAQNAISQAQTALQTAQDNLASVKAGADSLDLLSKQAQATVATYALTAAEENLADMTAPVDALTLEAKLAQVAVAQSALDAAQQNLADVTAPADPLDLNLSQQNVISAQAALDTSKQKLAGATLTSPIDGVITVMNLTAGQTIGANAEAMQVADTSVVEVAGNVDEIDVLFVKVGSTVQVTMDALAGETLTGSVTYVSSSSRTSNGVVSYPIKVQLQVPAGLQLRAGLSATANIVLREDDDVLLVPTQAVYGSFQQPTVKLVSANGSVQEQRVTLGNTDNFWVVVQSGLKQGDRIVMETTQVQTSGQLNARTLGQAFGGQGGGFAIAGGGIPTGGGQNLGGAGGGRTTGGAGGGGNRGN